MTAIYPVGHIYTTVASGNPNSLLAGMSGTTWVSFGAGKTLIGLTSADADFNQIEETGGHKVDTTSSGSHALTEAQIPAHTHVSRWPRSNTSGGGGPIHPCLNAGDGGAVSVTTQSTGGGSGHTHTNAIDVVQPYIVVYFWKRTA